MKDRVITKKEQEILVDIFKNCSMNAIRDTLIDAGIFDEDFPHFYNTLYTRPIYKPMKSRSLTQNVTQNESVSKIIGYLDGLISSTQSKTEYDIYQKLRNYIKYL